MLHNAIRKAYEQFDSRKYEKIYFAVDIHGTVADPDYKNVSSALYATAIEPLQVISHLPEVSIILFSCCHPHDYKKYIDLFESQGIKISYFNCNPEVKNTETGCFDSKFYYSVIAEDKAGFDPYLWPSIRDAFLTARQFNKQILELSISNRIKTVLAG